MVDIVHRIRIKSPANKIYNALTSLDGLAQWWTEDVKGSGDIGGKIEFSFWTLSHELLGKMVMEVIELNNEKEIRWCCLEGPVDWIGTDISFQLSEQDNETILFFAHRNWREAVDFTAHCSMKWATFLLSLRDYTETGKGKPAPHDVKVDKLS